MNISLDIRAEVEEESLRAVTGYLQTTQKMLERSIDAMGSKVTEAIRRNIRAEAPHASGRLKRSIGPPQYQGKGRFMISIGAGLYRPYHLYVIRGSYPRKPIPINWLHPPYGGQGGWAMKYPARIPSNQFMGLTKGVLPRPPDNFMERGLRRAGPEMDSIISKNLDRILNHK